MKGSLIVLKKLVCSFLAVSLLFTNAFVSAVTVGGQENSTSQALAAGDTVEAYTCPEHLSENAWTLVGNDYLGAGGALSGGHYILEEDVNITEALTVAAGEEVCIDLNGHNITAPNTEGIRVFYNEGTLTVVDSAKNDGVISGGKFKGVNNDDTYFGATHALGGNIYNAGIFNLYGGTVSGGCVSSGSVYAKSRGGNIYGTAGSVINICGGTVTGGTVDRTGYTHTTKSIAGGGNIYSLGTVTISSGTVTEGKACCKYTNKIVDRSVYVYGGNIFMGAGSCLTITGGTISDGVIDSARTNESGAAQIAVGGGNIYARRATVSISGGTITGGKVEAAATGRGTASAAFANAGVYGGNIYADGGTMAISGGTVSNGQITLEAIKKGDTTMDDSAVLHINGGNIMVSEKTTATISGGTISGGNATSSGKYGVAEGKNLFVSGTFYLYGGTVSETTTDSTATICLYNGSIAGCDMENLAKCACAEDNGDGSYTVRHTGANDGTCPTCAYNYNENNVSMESGDHTFVEHVCTYCGLRDTCNGPHDYSQDPLVCGICGYARATLKITTVTLRPSEAGLYFSGELNWDEEDEEILSCGITVSLTNPSPVAEDSDGSCLYTKGNISALVTNIISSENDTDKNKTNACMPVYARAYVQLPDGKYIYSDAVQASLQQVVMAVDNKWDSLRGVQKKALKDMHESFADVMSNWSIPNLSDAGDLRIGYAKINITPDYPVGLRGYSNAESRMSTGKVTDIFATCIAATEGNETILVYTVDSIAMPHNTAESFRAAITEATDIPGEKIFIGATHSHSCPDTTGQYMTDLTQWMVEAAQEALDDLSPATMLAGTKDIDGMNFVRHYEMADGTYAGSNFGDFNKTIVGHATDADSQMVLVKFDREGGKQDVLMVNWQAHPDWANQLGYYMIAPSFVGPMRDKLEELSGMHVAYFTGAAGNLNPESKIDDEKHNLTWREYGVDMGELAYEALSTLKPVTGAGIKTSRQMLEVDIDHSWDHKLQQANDVYDTWKAGDKDKADALCEQYGFTSVYQAKAIRNRADMGETSNLEINAFSIGGVGFTTGTYEMFSDHSLYVKEKSPFDITFIITGCSSYIPSQKAFEYRSYEGDTGYYVPGTGEKLAEEYVKMLESVE